MSNLAAARLRLFGPASRKARDPKPFDHFTKADIFARVEMLEKRLSRARTLASRYAGNAHNAKHLTCRDEFHAIGAACDLSTEAPADDE
jgi:hypothetical protein